MKKTILPSSVMLLSAISAFAQGTINFNTRVTAVIVAHVYGLEVPPHGPDEFWRLTGNTPSETPAGTQTYTGALLTGSGFSTQLFGGPLGSLENALVAIGSPTTFRTGATLGGTPVPQMLVVPFIAPGGSGTFQVRAWDNAGGTWTSWDSANTINRGTSLLFTIEGLGDGALTSPADMVNFRSFCFGNTDPPTPEPSVSALLGFAAVGLWLFRRKQPVA